MLRLPCKCYKLDFWLNIAKGSKIATEVLNFLIYYQKVPLSSTIYKQEQG